MADPRALVRVVDELLWMLRRSGFSIATAQAIDAAAAIAEDEQVAVQELAGCLAPMLERLPSAHRDALVWTEVSGLSQVEAARRAGVSVSGMKSRVQRGRRQLRHLLEACCKVELDRRGAPIGLEQKAGDCGSGCGDCAATASPVRSAEPPSPVHIRAGRVDRRGASPTIRA
jgi:RNA polymerase sigma-70 factor (ECF subfamily)